MPPAPEGCPNTAAPRVWVLLGEGAGGNAQMLRLADALGWPYMAKQMRYNPLNRLPNPILGASKLSLDERRSDTLVPPWPDLVIAASRRSAPIARWIRMQSKGHTRLVHLLHTQAPLHHFDLVVTLPQFRVPDAPNVLRNTLPLNTLDDAQLNKAAQRWRGVFAHLPRPWIAVLVGGDSSSYRLDEKTAARLGASADETAQKLGGSVLVTTSPRTPEPAASIIFDTIRCPSYRYRWQPDDADNPYTGYLALADRFIVTGDSASLPAEACATGRPVTLFDWRPRGYVGSLPGLRRIALARSIERQLVYSGFIKPKRDFAAFHHRLAEHGLIGPSRAKTQVPDDMARTVESIRTLVRATDPGLRTGL